MGRVWLSESLVGISTTPVLVRHLSVGGSHVEIGRAIGDLAVGRHGISAEALLSDGRVVRARRDYFARNYPMHAHRMRGVAQAFGLRLDDDRFDFSVISFAEAGGSPSIRADACYRPPWTNENGHGLLRWTGGLPGGSGGPLYVMEWHPRGAAHASLALHGFDLLSGTVLGINSAGLLVSAVAAEPFDSTRLLQRRNRPVPAGVGLHELAVLRLVLDTCSTVDTAQAAILAARAFLMLTPVHCLVAERGGRSFAYEAHPDGSQSIIDGGAEPQVIATPSGSGIREGSEEPPARWACLIDQDRGSLELAFRPDAIGLGVDPVGRAGPTHPAPPGDSPPGRPVTSRFEATL